VARVLDWLEVGGRRLAQRASAAWSRCSRASRLALVLASLIAVAGAAVVASRLLLAALKTG